MKIGELRIVNEIPFKILICLNNSKTNSCVNISQQINCRYNYVIRYVKIFNEIGLVEMEKEIGQKKMPVYKLNLSDKGKQIAEILSRIEI